MPEQRMATVRGAAVAAEVDPVPKIGPNVPADTTRPTAATADHFRVLDTGDDGATTMVLYRTGAHIPPAHRDLPAVPATFDDTDGVWTPARKAGTR